MDLIPEPYKSSVPNQNSTYLFRLSVALTRMSNFDFTIDRKFINCNNQFMPEKINLKLWVLHNLVAIFIIMGMLPAPLLRWHFECFMGCDLCGNNLFKVKKFTPRFFKNLAIRTVEANIVSVIKTQRNSKVHSNRWLKS